mmetsp:Transcript_24648/g.62864  ORF Transcript_24648/g.62864 Transcript_24648/m.62864 type:complete len:354 (+) Transcript_24648:463-1524(+)
MVGAECARRLPTPQSCWARVPSAAPRGPTRPWHPTKCNSAGPCPRHNSPRRGPGHMPDGWCPATRLRTFESNTPCRAVGLVQWCHQISIEAGPGRQTAPRWTSGKENASSVCSCTRTHFRLVLRRRSPQKGPGIQPNHLVPPTATALRRYPTHAPVAVPFPGICETGASTEEIVQQGHVPLVPGSAVNRRRPAPPPPRAAHPSPHHSRCPRARCLRAGPPQAASRGSPSAARRPGLAARTPRASSGTTQERPLRGRSAPGATRSPPGERGRLGTIPGAALAAAWGQEATSGQTHARRPPAWCGSRARRSKTAGRGAHWPGRVVATPATAQSELVEKAKPTPASETDRHPASGT